mgnify:CR=1 FL=1
MKGKLRWVIVSLVALATIINYIDRGALAVLWPEISADVGMTKTDYAIIINVFTFAYAFGQTLFGKIFDWIGTRLGFVLAIGVWSVATMLHAISHSLLTFSIFRGLLGVSEAGNWPGATKANAEWFPIKERAFAQGIFNSGAAIGVIGVLIIVQSGRVDDVRIEIRDGVDEDDGIVDDDADQHGHRRRARGL